MRNWQTKLLSQIEETFFVKLEKVHKRDLHSPDWGDILAERETCFQQIRDINWQRDLHLPNWKKSVQYIGTEACIHHILAIQDSMQSILAQTFTSTRKVLAQTFTIA